MNPSDSPFQAYFAIAQGLLPSVSEMCLLGPSFELLERTPGMPLRGRTEWQRAAGSERTRPVQLSEQNWLSAIPIETGKGGRLGVLCVQQGPGAPAGPQLEERRVRDALAPLVSCIQRDLSCASPSSPGAGGLGDQAEELGWLLDLGAAQPNGAKRGRMIEQLMDAAGKRIQCGLAVLFVPSKRMCIERSVAPVSAPALGKAWIQVRQHVLSWVQRQNRPLWVNAIGRAQTGEPQGKLLAVPVASRRDRVIGVLAFLKATDSVDFGERHQLLANLIGRQAGQIIEAQFDPTTGLYDRPSVEEKCEEMLARAEISEHSLIYLDVDHMHLVNELYGFELGDELLVRIADLLAPPLLPEAAIAARIDTDRFAVLLPACGSTTALGIAGDIRDAAARIVLGPLERPVEVSLSGGVAQIVPMPMPFQHALASAELACKTARARGRGCIDIYALDDESMMQRHADVMALGQLRDALKNDRLMLYAQPIVSLRDPEAVSGYEILLRMRHEDGSIESPAEFIAAAHRYQVLPSIDKWVTERALEMLAPFRELLASSGIGISINVTGQSISDRAFVGQLAQNVKAARLPADCLTIEITEQAAVVNLSRADGFLSYLAAYGCKFALDDFGTGSNSLSTLQNLRISRVKIDASFVREVVTDIKSRSTVRAIVELAGGQAIDTVAEGVESMEVAAELAGLGVDFVQGFAFGRPQPLAEVLRSLRRDDRPSEDGAAAAAAG